jgi:hypothetical protein
VLNRLCLLPFLVALVAPLQAQDDGPIKMTPEFPLTFPLVLHGTDVTIKFPILINPVTVLKPGMVLRIIYILNYGNADGSNDLILAHKGNMEQAYARGMDSTSDQSKMPPELAHEIEGYRRTVWEVPNNFMLAMAQYPTDAMHLIYSRTGKDKEQDLSDDRFSFLDGLFVGLPGGKVTVLAVEDESKADKAGLKAGDEILAVGGISTRNDLEGFSSAFVAARDKAREDELPSYEMTVRSEGSSGARTVDIPMPPSLKSTFLNGP